MTIDGMHDSRSALVSAAQRTLRTFALLWLVLFLIGYVGSWSWWARFLAVVIGGIAFVATLVAATVRASRRFGRIAITYPGVVARLAIAITPIALALVTLCLMSPLSVFGSHAGTLSRLGINYWTYMTIIDDAQAGIRHPVSGFAYERYHGVEYEVDAGPPVRVAFNPEGFLDNWSGIIFDPTGQVMRANGFDSVTGEFAAPDDVTKLFGGDLVLCRPLWGDFYNCSFT